MSEIKFLEKLTNHLEKLPGVGKKTAQRYAYYIADKMSKEDVENFAKDLIEKKLVERNKVHINDMSIVE